MTVTRCPQDFNIVCIDFVAISELSYHLLQRVIISACVCMQDSFARARTRPRPSARATIGYLVYNACVHSDLPCSIVYKYYTTHHGGTPTLG